MRRTRNQHVVNDLGYYPPSGTQYCQLSHLWSGRPVVWKGGDPNCPKSRPFSLRRFGRWSQPVRAGATKVRRLDLHHRLRRLALALVRFVQFRQREMILALRCGWQRKAKLCRLYSSSSWSSWSWQCQVNPRRAPLTSSLHGAPFTRLCSPPITAVAAPATISKR